ncbi:MAG: hypothetical protein FJ404_02155 [Verrucomicrobia bacterium]|nr:hypothetical protein [Verrucomicrobiota bacterium]
MQSIARAFLKSVISRILQRALFCLGLASACLFSNELRAAQRYLYAAVPGIRNYLEYGGHGVLVFDMDRDYRFVRRIPAGGLNNKGEPSNVKGIAACAKTSRLYVTTLEAMTCFDLATDKILWERKYEGGCDRLSITPDGAHIYLPSLEKDHWHVVDGSNGEVLKKIIPKSGAHNTLVSLDGRHAFLAGLKSPLLRVVDVASKEVVKEIGPFSHSIRPFTVNGKATLCFVNVNDLLGFEIGDLRTGRMLHRVEVQGFQKGPIKRHGCPSHGVGLTPDEKEVWVVDAANTRVHVFDATVMPPRQKESVALREQPGWVTFTLDGRHALLSTGEIIEVQAKRITASLQDEKGRQVHSEKVVEIHFENGKPVRNGDQFGIGRVL